MFGNAFHDQSVHVCRCCGSERILKNGRAENGDQRARCLDCGRTFVLQPKGARSDQRFKDPVVAAYQDRMSIRGITRTVGVCYETVPRWVGGGKSGDSPGLRGHALARWERRRARTRRTLKLRAGENTATLALGGPLPTHPPDRGLDTLGDRSLQDACDLRTDLPPGYRRCATRSDHRDAYAAAFPKKTHRACGKADGETCHVERWFGTPRARTSRLVRRAYSFSKHAENHLDAIHLFVTTYNLAILHKATAN